MRISDWSSDVCSSDLELAALASAAVANRPRSALGVAPNDLVSRLKPQLRGAAAGDFKHRLHRPARIDRVQGERRGHRGDSKHPPARRDENNVKSEEHTSELQSLMRL